jgi:hypothetical protein
MFATNWHHVVARKRVVNAARILQQIGEIT